MLIMSETLKYSKVFDTNVDDVSYELYTDAMMKIITNLSAFHKSETKKAEDLVEKLSWYQSNYDKLSSRYLDLHDKHESISKLLQMSDPATPKNTQDTIAEAQAKDGHIMINVTPTSSNMSIVKSEHISSVVHFSVICHYYNQKAHISLVGQVSVCLSVCTPLLQRKIYMHHQHQSSLWIWMPSSPYSSAGLSPEWVYMNAFFLRWSTGIYLRKYWPLVLTKIDFFCYGRLVWIGVPIWAVCSGGIVTAD